MPVVRADVEHRAEPTLVPAKAGTVILFNNLCCSRPPCVCFARPVSHAPSLQFPRCFHGSGENLSERIRWSLDWRYAPTVPDDPTEAERWWFDSMDARSDDDWGPIEVCGPQGAPGWEAWSERARAYNGAGATSRL